MSRQHAVKSGGRTPRRRRKQRTLWHPIACDCIEFTLPTGYEALREHVLHREPQRLDLLVILQESALPGEIDQLPALMSRLGKVTLIEYKGVTDRLEDTDASVVTGYGAQLMVQRGLKPEDITLGVIAVEISTDFRQRVREHGGRLEAVAPGIWEGQLIGSRLFMLETAQVWQRSEQDKLFYLLTPQYLKQPERLFPLTPEQELLYNEIAARFIARRPEGGMALRNYEELKANYDRILQERLSRMPPEERFRGATVEDRLKGLNPEDRLKGLNPEDLVKGLTPEQREQLKLLLG